jgi:hypothetical protein
MESAHSYVSEAIPHEAGHIVVGMALGIPIRGLTVNIVRDDRGTMIGDFATLSVEPPDEEIPRTPPKLLAAYKLFVAGGLAGNRFASVPAAEESIQSDRKRLARVGTESLEEVADMAAAIIEGRRRKFRRLISVIRQRFLDLMSSNNLQTGPCSLLNEQDLNDILSRP